MVARRQPDESTGCAYLRHRAVAGVAGTAAGVTAAAADPEISAEARPEH